MSPLRSPLAGLSLTVALLASFDVVAAPVDVPFNVGIGPGIFVFSGPMYADQPIHTGVRLQLKAVLDAELARANVGKMPAVLAERIIERGELRIGYWMVPESLFLSPRREQTSVWGATWRLGSFHRSWGRTVRLHFAAGGVFTFAKIRSRRVRSPTQFARPGGDVSLEVEVALGPWFRLSLGGSSQLYLPQRLGTRAFGSLLSGFRYPHQSIWHIGQAHLALHGRIPVEVNL